MSELAVNVELSRGGFSLGVDVLLPAQGVTVLLGPSGSGKSTLLRILAGLEPVSDGYIRKGSQVWLNGANSPAMPSQKRNIGFVFQDYALFPHLTVFDNIAFGVKDNNRKTKNAIVHSWLERLQLVYCHI